MGTIRHSVETLFAAVAFAERDQKTEAAYLVRSLETRQDRRPTPVAGKTVTSRPAPRRRV